MQKMHSLDDIEREFVPYSPKILLDHLNARYDNRFWIEQVDNRFLGSVSGLLSAHQVDIATEIPLYLSPESEDSMMNLFFGPGGLQKVGHIYVEKGTVWGSGDHELEAYRSIQLKLPAPVQTAHNKVLPALSIKYLLTGNYAKSELRRDHERLFWNMGWTKTSWEDIVPKDIFKKEPKTI